MNEPFGPVRWTNLRLLRLLWCAPLAWMLGLLVLEAALAATTTALVIEAARDVLDQQFLVIDFVWIVAAQSASYAVGASSWIFAERAGFGAFGRYLMQFTRANRYRSVLLTDHAAREQVEPFLTNETFHIFFELVYELEADLKLLFALVFNAIVLGVAIDPGLPLVYAAVFAALLAFQWSVRRPIASAYLLQQRTVNRMTAQTYSAWDNIYSGNRYNFRLWHAEFKSRLRAALAAQIRAIVAKEGIAAASGIFALVVVFGYLATVAARQLGDTALLIALAATLPRQIDLSMDVHGLAAGWNDLLALWTRLGGVRDAMLPPADHAFEQRIEFPRLTWTQSTAGADPAAPASASAAPQQSLAGSDLARIVELIDAQSRGRFSVRGGNGAGKSTLLVALKARLGQRAYYWPTHDRLAFAFAAGQVPASDGDDADDADDAATDGINAPAQPHAPPAPDAAGRSSGERQLQALAEIVRVTTARIYLLDEWDANLDAANRLQAERLVNQLAARAVVVEISHRDRY